MRITGLMCCAMLAACGSVAVPTERFYRLQPPAATAPSSQRAGTLRVTDLQLGTALDSDRLLRQHGVRLEPRPLSRWVAPLDRMISDALVLGLSRARVCDLVKGSADAGGEDWTLHGRIVDFVEIDCELEGGAAPVARVALELWLEQHGALCFHEEFVASEVLAEPGADAVVAALSRGLQGVVTQVVEQMRQRDLFAQVLAERAAAAQLATPGR